MTNHLSWKEAGRPDFHSARIRVELRTEDQTNKAPVKEGTTFDTT